ncbi:MAG: DUF695 domain-containing protein [Deltaproteobacteria bacterium]|nr:DUF695 domain-containing protein [Deltaproteobacteria bacterium]
MGVIGTQCALCALPLEHNHYVPMQDGSGMLKIYDPTMPDLEAFFAPGEPVVRFGPEHAWLRAAVGLKQYANGPDLIRGVVDNGVLEDRSTGYTSELYDDEHLGFHEVCWRAMGEPKAVRDATIGRGSFDYARVEPYMGQLFDFHALIADGKGWMLIDPEGTSSDASRSQQRIKNGLAHGVPWCRLKDESPTTIAGVLGADRPWVGRSGRNDEGERAWLSRLRTMPFGCELDGYATLIWFIKEYDGNTSGMPTADTLALLEDFEVALKDTIEHEHEAILVKTLIGANQGQYIAYSKNEAGTMARIQALPNCDTPKPSGFDNEQDAEWRVYFEDLV